MAKSTFERRDKMRKERRTKMKRWWLVVKMVVVCFRIWVVVWRWMIGDGGGERLFMVVGFL